MIVEFGQPKEIIKIIRSIYASILKSCVSIAIFTKNLYRTIFITIAFRVFSKKLKVLKFKCEIYLNIIFIINII